MSVETKLTSLVEDRIVCLGEIEMGTDEDKIATEAVAKLLHERNEMISMEIERDQKERIQEKEFELKAKQIENDKKIKTVEIVIDGIVTVLSYVVLGVGSYKILKFEETGTITSNIGKMFIGFYKNLFKKL